jgi:hypothetical protein
MEDFRKRLLEFIERHLGVSQREFERMCGLSQGIINKTGPKGPSVEVLWKISNKFPELNLNWLVAGSGEMLIGDSSQNTLTINIGNWGELVKLLNTKS